ncbi:splicing factor, suppressor of white-apricot homolog isoform X2 [Patiria miniata]|uniref:Splicing factor, suppressor of white-apricot homolog n=1 Tax=Patiria miniata TaxID=46514 RepID=A0A914A492_PATMI|nr:splicing factor, suppressor of white-apricot homolog isoform X1 [Patiria miniata]XP_038058672.1 splicing factor, suppressor of white-apricot homolog isoform X2 [Patiria miniata]
MAQISKKMKTKRAHLVDAKKMEAKKSRQEEVDEICVVGYQCRLFRDDERALAIDREEHLIPWMGEASLMIDRYDGRGHLPSLSEYEDSWLGSRRQEISGEEERIEALCDEERYMALHKDMMEEELRQEEEIKRLNLAIASSDSTYNQVMFSYDQGKDEYDPMRPTEDEEQFAKTPPECQSPEAELEEPFIAPAEMDIPIGVEMPGTKKTHKFMEKTAMFIMSQGSQMEIILKTKQANNPQFDFLQFDHYLNPYYKHLLKCIKSGKYKGVPEDDEDENHKKQGGNNRVRKHSNASSSGDDDDDDDDNDNSGYLHPSLLGQSRPRPTPMQAGTTTIQTSTSMPPASSYHPPMDFSKPPPIMGYHDPNFLPQAVDPPLMGPSGYYDQPNVYPMFQPPPPPPPSGAALSLPTVPPPHFSGVDPAYVMANPHPTLPPAHSHAAPLGLDPNVLPHQESPSVPPSADISEADVPRVIPPPPDIQPVIDKLAKFVAKNGTDFEASVRSKSDPRFDFLLPWHKYNTYYMQKKKMFIGEMGGKAEEEEEDRQEEKTKKVSVSFSIKAKAPKEERPLERKSALPVESSDSEEEEERPPLRLPPPESLTREVRGDDLEGQRSWGDNYPGQPPFNPAFRGRPFVERTELPPYEGPYQEGTYREPAYREPAYGEPPVLEYSEYPDPYTERDGSQLRGAYDRGRGITEEEWQMKQAKLRLEDRLASAAREKMASASKERIQQMERRKKAAVFLSMIKDRPQAGAAAELDNMEPEPNDIPTTESLSPPEKQRKTDSRTDRKKHKKHKHRHGSSSGSSRRSPSPDKKHKRPPRSYQDANRFSASSSREGDNKPRARSTSPGVRSRPVTPPRSYQMGRNRSPKRWRRSRSRSNSPVRPVRTLESLPRRSSSLEASSLPIKSRSLSPENGRNFPAASVEPMVLDAAPPSPSATPPLSSEPTPDDSVSDSYKEPPMETSEENGSTTTTSTTAATTTTSTMATTVPTTAATTTDTSFQDNFRAKIRAMLAATRTMDFQPS